MICKLCRVEFTETKPWQKYCSKLCKRKYRSINYTEEDKEHIKQYMSKYKYTPRARYAAHRGTAKRRGIGFLLTFEEWWSIWEIHFNERGRGKDSLVMCRVGDIGDYEVGNVYIGTYSKNSSDAIIRNPRSRNPLNGRFVSEDN